MRPAGTLDDLKLYLLTLVERLEALLFDRGEMDEYIFAALALDKTVPLLVTELLWEATRSVLYGSIFLFVLLLFGLVQSVWALGILVAMIVSGFLFALMGMVAVSLAKAHEHLFYYITLIITPMFMFSGIFFPVDRLPETIQWIVRLLPLYHVVEINRALALGIPDSGILLHFAALLVMIAVVAPIPARLLRRALETE